VPGERKNWTTDASMMAHAVSANTYPAREKEMIEEEGTVPCELSFDPCCEAELLRPLYNTYPRA
jgi:hypothetical protein